VTARRRTALLVAASAIGIGGLVALDEPADELLSVHMLQHMLIGDLAPLLALLAVRGTILGRALAAVRPAPALLVWGAALAVWHVPSLYDAALENEQLHMFEHATFAVAGLLVWAVLLDVARRGRLPGWRGFGYAIVLLAASMILSNVLVLSYRPLYPAYGDLRDQNLAALVMMVEQFLTLGTFAVLRARALLREQEIAPARPHELAA
jgi:cytochrome c oxidase assembly factor CtaG